MSLKAIKCPTAHKLTIKKTDMICLKKNFLTISKYRNTLLLHIKI